MSLRARLLALLVLVSLVSSASAFARVEWVCRMSGRVGPACCCGHQKPTKTSASAELRRSDCCEASVSRSEARLAVDPEGTPRVVVGSLSAVLSSEPDVLPLRAMALVVSPRRSRAPPLLGPPLYIRHCAFLS